MYFVCVLNVQANIIIMKGNIVLIQYSATACCHWGHLDKVVQLDYKKITIHSEKFGCQS